MEFPFFWGIFTVFGGPSGKGILQFFLIFAGVSASEASWPLQVEKTTRNARLLLDYIFSFLLSMHKWPALEAGRNGRTRSQCIARILQRSRVKCLKTQEEGGLSKALVWVQSAERAAWLSSGDHSDNITSSYEDNVVPSKMHLSNSLSQYSVFVSLMHHSPNSMTCRAHMKKTLWATILLAHRPCHPHPDFSHHAEMSRAIFMELLALVNSDKQDWLVQHYEVWRMQVRAHCRSYRLAWACSIYLVNAFKTHLSCHTRVPCTSWSNHRIPVRIPVNPPAPPPKTTTPILCWDSFLEHFHERQHFMNHGVAGSGVWILQWQSEIGSSRALTPQSSREGYETTSITQRLCGKHASSLNFVRAL